MFGGCTALVPTGHMGTAERCGRRPARRKWFRIVGASERGAVEARLCHAHGGCPAVPATLRPEDD